MRVDQRTAAKVAGAQASKQQQRPRRRGHGHGHAGTGRAAVCLAAGAARPGLARQKPIPLFWMGLQRRRALGRWGWPPDSIESDDNTLHCIIIIDDDGDRPPPRALFPSRTPPHPLTHPTRPHHTDRYPGPRTMTHWWRLPFRDFVAKEVMRPGFREFAVGAVYVLCAGLMCMCVGGRRKAVAPAAGCIGGRGVEAWGRVGAGCWVLSVGGGGSVCMHCSLNTCTSITPPQIPHRLMHATFLTTHTHATGSSSSAWASRSTWVSPVRARVERLCSLLQQIQRPQSKYQAPRH